MISAVENSKIDWRNELALYLSKIRKNNAKSTCDLYERWLTGWVDYVEKFDSDTPVSTKMLKDYLLR